MSLEVDDGIKQREELDSIFDKYITESMEVEMIGEDNDIHILVRETEITENLVLPFELLEDLNKAGYKVKKLMPALEDDDGETFAILNIVIGWKN